MKISTFYKEKGEFTMNTQTIIIVTLVGIMLIIGITLFVSLLAIAYMSLKYEVMEDTLLEKSNELKYEKKEKEEYKEEIKEMQKEMQKILGKCIDEMMQRDSERKFESDQKLISILEDENIDEENNVEFNNKMKENSQKKVEIRWENKRIGEDNWVFKKYIH